MKKIVLLTFLFLSLTLIILANTPNLMGTWNASVERIADDTGFTKVDFGKVKFVITHQQGRVFTGYKEYFDHTDQVAKQEKFSGAFGANDREIYLAEHEDGYGFGDILTENVMFLYYVESKTEHQSIYYHLMREQSNIPDLRGEWSFELIGGHIENLDDFIKGSNGKYVITEQNGHVFKGEKVLNKINGETVNEGFSGTISFDGRKIYIAEHDDGYCFGQLLESREIYLNYLEDDEAKAAVMILRRNHP